MNDDTGTRVNKLLRQAFGESNETVLRQVIESVGGVTVEDIHVARNDGSVEVWMDRPAAWTGEELRDIQRLFEVEELGVYGDPMLAGTEEDNGLEGTFHAILTPSVGGETDG